MSHDEHTPGKTIVITGSSDGIGRAAARDLAARGHHVVIVGRSPEKTAAVARELDCPSYLTDFARLDSVRELAGRLGTDLPRIDVLVNNAGGVFGPGRDVTVDGHEKTFQVDYLAPFLLTGMLLDQLVADRATVINTSSVANRLFGHVDLDDLESSRGPFDARRAYGTAKLEQILFTRELHRRYRAHGLASAAFHPGIIGSNFASAPGSALGRIYQNPLAKRLLGSPESGARTLVWLAENCPSPACRSGGYFARRRTARPAGQALDAAMARELWERSVRLSGLDHVLPKRHDTDATARTDGADA